MRHRLSSLPRSQLCQSVKSRRPPPCAQSSTSSIQFADGLCSCTNDPKLCLATMCIPAVPIAQLWERVMLPRGSRISFWAIAAVLLVCGAIVTSVQGCPQPTIECQQTHTGKPRCHTVEYTVPPMCSFAGSVQAFACLFGIALLVILRYAAVLNERVTRIQRSRS